MRVFICLCWCIFAIFKVHATHILGLDLGYKHIARDTYQVKVVFFADCGATVRVAQYLSTAHPFIKIYKGNTLFDTLSLRINPLDTGSEITTLCTGAVSQCNDLTSPLPGYKKYEYFKSIVLPDTSRVWRFVFDGDLGYAYLAGRINYCTNIAFSGSYIYLEDTLNNTLAPNSSPSLNTNMPTALCLNFANTYTPDARDPDSDSLVYSLVSLIDGGTLSSCTYVSGLSGALPIHCATGSFSFNSNTGIINFTPDLIQVPIIKYNIREYRRGVFVGSSQREQPLFIKDCTTAAMATIDSVLGGFTIGGYTVKVCDSVGDYNYYINPQELDTSVSITVTAIGLPSGATFNVTNNGTNHPHCVFSWTTTGVTPGTYGYDLNFVDNRCPTPLVNNKHYTIKVLTPEECAALDVPPVNTPTQGITITPQPATDQWQFVWNVATKMPFQYSIYGLDGKMMYTQIAQTNETITPIVQLPRGLYYIKLVGAGQSVVHPLVIGG